MFALRPVRRGRRTATPSPARGSRQTASRRYYRRNPALFGVEMEDAMSVVGGIWGAQQVSTLASGPAAPIVKFFDGIRSGLGQAALTAGSAIVLGWGAGRWKRRVGNLVAISGVGLGLNQAVVAFTGANPMAGQPNLASGVKLPALSSGQSTETKTTAAPALPSVVSQL